MQQPLCKSILKNLWLWIPLLLLLAQQGWSQCNNGSQFGTINAPTNNTPTTITTCAFGGEYSTINSCTAGSTYQFSATGGAGNYLTVRQGTPGGTVLGFGFSPISVVCTVSGPLYLHYNTDAACGTDGSCHTGVVQCTSCPGAADPCTSISTIACATNTTATLSGTGLWNPGSCGFSTPGVEKIYSFTPATTGTYSLQVSSTSSTGYIDYFYKAASGGCNATGWTCIDDIFSPFTATIGTLTAGTTYYILLDPETSSSVTQTFQIVCPSSFDPCASIATLSCGTAVTATPSGTGVWNPLTCGFSTPGQERVYAFTPTFSGTHNLQVNSVSGGYIDYFWKAASGGCNATGWSCIDDINFTGTFPIGSLTAGTTYYILLDPEGTGSYSHNFQIVCATAAPPCIVSPTFPTNSSTVCPNSNITLSWPASAGATSYDVYFGTTSTPVFWGNTASTNINVGVQTTGTRFWQILPRNASGPASGCNIWSFTLSDNTPPTITCPASVMANNSPATACSAVVTYGSISASDNCSPPSIILQSGLPSGSTYPVGVTTIVYRATDGVGLTATCSFTVTVKDVTLPTITCPANIVKANDLGLCGAATTYAIPTATDNCGIASVSQLSGLASGSVFPVGTTTNVWRAVDVNTNSSTCSFTVTVNDTEKPSINCPSDITKGTDFGDCSANLGINLGAVSVQDNCVGVTTTNNSPGIFQLGTTIVTWIAKDGSNNSTSCVQNITIEDNEHPVIACPANINVKTDEGDCAAIVNFAASATDNCPGVTVDYSSDPGSSFGIGLANIEVTATDGSGNISSCFFQISVGAREELCNGLDDDCDGWVDEAQDWTSLIKRFANDGAASEEYGVSVDIHGDYAIVGSDQKNASGQSLGSAYILFRDQNGDNKWGQIAELSAPGLLAGDNFGASVSIAAGVAAVGAPLDDDQFGNQGAVYMFHQNPNNPAQWDFVKVVVANDPASADNFGSSVALDSDRLLVGSDQNDASGTNSGAAYMFYRNTGGADNWGQVAKLVASTGAADDNMGNSVDLDGDYAVVGAPGVDGLLQNSGAAYIFGRNQFGPDAWGQVSRMRANQAGQNDNFGGSVGISGPWAIVGADRNDLKGTDAGAAFIFYKNQNGINNSWGQRQIILEYNGSAGDHFGSGVAIDEPYAVVSAEGDDPFGANSGGAYVYLLDGNVWVTVDQLADGGGQQDDALGSCVAIHGRNLILGAPLDNNGTNVDQGAVIVYGGLCNADNRPQANRDQPTESALESALHCYPVPFSDVLNIELKGMQAQDAQLSIVNSMGQEVANLHKGLIEGDMLFQWQATEVADGLYFLRLVTGDKVLTKTIVRTR